VGLELGILGIMAQACNGPRKAALLGMSINNYAQSPHIDRGSSNSSSQWIGVRMIPCTEYFRGLIGKQTDGFGGAEGNVGGLEGRAKHVGIPEPGEFDCATWKHEDCVWLDVAMGNTKRMKVRYGISELREKIHSGSGGA
jgi:hypothetical protein